MTTRQTIKNTHDPNKPVDHLANGYDDTNSTSEYTIPSCGIEDAETALFNLFDKEMGFTNKAVNGKNGPIQMKKPNVIFSTGERFAIVKKLRPSRDSNNAHLLPLISIRRQSLEQTDQDITQRGINQNTGVLTIKRRLDSSDMDYQNLLNRFMFKNQAPSAVTSRRTPDSIADDLMEQGALLDPQLTQNIFEIISIPQPQFYTSTYEITFWTTHVLHMNYLIETLFSSFLPQGKMFRLESPKGYWFMAYVDDMFTSKDNFDDFTDQERLVQYSFNLRIKGYMLASNHPTNEVAVRRTVSAPQVSFDISQFPGEVDTKKNVERPNETGDQFVLTDIELDQNEKQLETTMQKYLLKKKVINNVKGTVETKYIQITDQNTRKGETVYKASDSKTLLDMLYEKKEPRK